jgi:hypothetical protein
MGWRAAALLFIIVVLVVSAFAVATGRVSPSAAMGFLVLLPLVPP